MKISNVDRMSPLQKMTDNGGGKHRDKELKKACDDFESILVGQMLKSMRGTLEGDKVFGKSFQRDMYQSMFDEKLATDISRGENGLGISDVLYRQLTKYNKIG